MRSPSPKELEEVQDEEAFQIHPLFIPHIIKNVLIYCSFEDLKTTRLVSKQWNQYATENFKKKAKLRFYNYRHLDNFMTLSQCRPDGFIFPSDFTRNICLYGRDFQDWVILLKPFFSRYGSFIKSLDISHGIGDVTEEFLLQIAQHIESLEELSISGSPGALYSSWANDAGFQFYPMLPSVKILNLALPRTCFKRWADVKTFFTDFFTVFPNVREIKFMGYQFTELFKYLPDDVKFNRLNSVHLHVYNSEGFSQFTRRNFSLSKIILDIEPLLGLNNLHAFLESFAPTLKHLELGFNYKGPYNYAHNATKFPSSKALKKLEHLSLYGFWGNLYFIEDFPKLRSACVEKMQWDIAFPQGTKLISCFKRRIFKFYDENSIFHALV